MSARVLTPTLIICGAAAIGGGIALARPAAQAVPTASTATAAAEAPAAPATSDVRGYGRKPTATTAPRASAPSGQAGGAAKDQAPAGGAAKAANLTISGFAFGAPLTVSPGTKVAVSNRDSAPHTVTGSAFDTGTVGGGASGTFTAPAAAGTYRFACEIHPSMTGSLTVR